MDDNAELMKNLLEANRDFEERLRTSQFRVNYDSEHDMLLITIGVPQEAITEQISKGLYMRFDPETDKIVGMTITSFRRSFLREHRDLKKHFDTVFPARRRIDAWEFAPQSEASEAASTALRHLVPA